jgi:exodeoxyribonuclease VII small subunit
MPKEAKRDTFEQLYARLEQQVGKLEQGGMSLEEAIAAYEEGMTLARACQERLDEAELKITKLRESFATLPARPNGASGEDEPEDYEYVTDDEPMDEDEPFT